jgi:ParB family chromosome partitioning protein
MESNKSSETDNPLTQDMGVLGFRLEELVLRTIPLERLVVAPDNVRRRNITGGVDELAENIRQLGQQQPILVEPDAEQFRIVVGQRRYLAAKQLGAPSIMALVLPRMLSDDERALISLSENMQRRDLDPEDKGRAFEYLVERLGSIDAVAKAIGTSTVTVRKWLGYRAVPEPVRKLVKEGSLTVPAAIRIARSTEDEGQAFEIAKEFASIRPVGEERDRLLAAIEEFSDRPLPVILEKARDARYSVRVTFVLPDHWARALGRAAAEEGRDPEDIAREATIEWLQAREI